MPSLNPRSRARLWAALLTAGACLLSARSAHAQPQLDNALPTPRLYTLTPCGGKQGTTVEVSFTGVDLESPEQLRFSHPGIKAEPIPSDAPPPDPKKPAPAPSVAKFKVTIPADLPVGFYDVRLANKWGVSNARTFVVGDLTEVLEKEPNNDVAEAQRVELNSTVNGSMASPTDVDYYVFPGKKGQRVVVSCLASSIDSRFNAAVEVYNAAGKLLASNRNYAEHDALTDLTLPDDGDYHVRVFAFTHTQGNAEHFYRLSISTAPWIDAVHPAVVEPGKTVELTVYGRNLPGGKLDPDSVVDGRTLEKVVVSVAVPNDPATLQRLTSNGHLDPATSAQDGFEYRIKNGALTSNGFLLTYARAPLVRDSEKTRTADTAQEISVPCEIAGRVEKRRDRDWYVFSAKKGEVYNIELLSERLGAPTLMYFVLRNAATKQDIVESQDDPDPFSQKFFARSEDPKVYRFTVPADGKYLLLVGSRLADTIAGPRHYYRVRITPDQPDFRLVVVPYANGRQDAATVGQGGNTAFTVLAWRRDGFNGDIHLSAEGLPPGVTCPPQGMNGTQRQATLVLSAAADAAAWTGDIKIKGTATIKGQKVEREARPGGIVWQLQQPQQLTPTISRLDRSLALAVRDKAPYGLAATIDKAVLTQGDKATITLKVTRNWPEAKGAIAVVTQIQGVPTEFPQGLTIPNATTLQPNAAEAPLAVSVGTNVPPGVYNLVFRSQTTSPFNKDPKAPQKPNVNIVQPSSAVTVTILPKALGTLSLNSNNPQVKVGAEAQVGLKVQRLFGYDGEFKVQVIPPPGVQGISIADVAVPAGKDDAVLVVKAAADAAPGNRTEIVVRATAMYNNNPVVQEIKFAVNVVK
jgi:hypothetical protein